MRQIFDEVQKISKCGWFDMPMRSTFEIGTQIILLKFDGFLKGWILNITPLKALWPKIFPPDLKTSVYFFLLTLYVHQKQRTFSKKHTNY